MQQMLKITGTACHGRNVLLDATLIIGDSYWYGQADIYFCSELKVWLESSMGFAFSTKQNDSSGYSHVDSLHFSCLICFSKPREIRGSFSFSLSHWCWLQTMLWMKHQRDLLHRYGLVFLSHYIDLLKSSKYSTDWFYAIMRIWVKKN